MFKAILFCLVLMFVACEDTTVQDVADVLTPSDVADTVQDVSTAVEDVTLDILDDLVDNDSDDITMTE